MSTLISKHRLGDIVGTIIGVAEIIIEVGGDAVLQEFLVVLDGLLIVAFLVLRIRILLGDGRGREGSHQEECQYPQEGIRLLVSLGTILVLLASQIDGIFYFHDSSHCRFKSLVHITRCIAWSITLKLTLIQRLGKLLDGFHIDCVHLQLVLYVLTG